MTVELLRQQKELMKTIAKKDKEIKDYKENGATISRSNYIVTTISVILIIIEHLETLPFDELAFKNEMILTEVLKTIDLINNELTFRGLNFHQLAH